jgi:CheY-like chemotaxis protein
MRRAATMSQAKILVIEDDPAVLDVLHETLTESEYIVFFASDGSRGIQLAKETLSMPSSRTFS